MAIFLDTMYTIYIRCHLELGADCELAGDILVEPAVEDHVADGGAHRGQVEAEEREVVEPEMSSK